MVAFLGHRSLICASVKMIGIIFGYHKLPCNLNLQTVRAICLFASRFLFFIIVVIYIGGNLIDQVTWGGSKGCPDPSPWDDR